MTVRQRRALQFGKFSAVALIGFAVGAVSRSGEVSQAEDDRYLVLSVLAEEIEDESPADQWAVYEIIGDAAGRAKHPAFADFED